MLVTWRFAATEEDYHSENDAAHVLIDVDCFGGGPAARSRHIRRSAPRFTAGSATASESIAVLKERGCSSTDNSNRYAL